MSNQQKTKGFTIIEVVLVLAIAGLIFLVVFLAVPALQRQQRDTQRRSDASRVSSYLANYKSNNNGKLPTAAADQTSFITTYVKNTAAGGQAAGLPTDPTPGDDVRSPGNNLGYDINFVGVATEPDVSLNGSVETMVVHVGARCTGETATASTGKYAVRVELENGGFYCVGEN